MDYFAINIYLTLQSRIKNEESCAIVIIETKLLFIIKTDDKHFISQFIKKSKTLKCKFLLLNLEQI